MSSIIQVTDLSKSFTISHESQKSYTTLRDTIGNKTKKLFSFPFKLSGVKQQASSKEEFWALKNINFEIERGDRVGIIGRNGAGKSTLLKILSRITEPTSGEIRIRGRVASLLEVGTGFHPELTGRENIFLNGAILGMSRAEIKRKFDEIVEFAEVEKFLDTPVKRYSSGMYVRLAFAVAAHLEPEILIVDEVLAVGDAQFQKKCLGKMEDVSKNEGRTVLFVSHNMAAITNLCNKGIMLKGGTIGGSGNIHDVIQNYLDDSENINAVSLALRKDRKGNGMLRFTKVELKNDNKEIIKTIQTGQDFYIDLHYKKNVINPIANLKLAIALENKYGERITHLNNEIVNTIIQIGSDALEGIISIAIKKIPITSGSYNLIVYSEAGGEVIDWIKNAFILEIEDGDFYGTGKIMPIDQGNFLLDYRFEIK